MEEETNKKTKKKGRRAFVQNYVKIILKNFAKYLVKDLDNDLTNNFGMFTKEKRILMQEVKKFVEKNLLVTKEQKVKVTSKIALKELLFKNEGAVEKIVKERLIDFLNPVNYENWLKDFKPWVPETKNYYRQYHNEICNVMKNPDHIANF